MAMTVQNPASRGQCQILWLIHQVKKKKKKNLILQSKAETCLHICQSVLLQQLLQYRISKEIKWFGE